MKNIFIKNKVKYIRTDNVERGSYFNLYEDGFDDVKRFRINLAFS